MLGYYERNRDFVELCQFELNAEMRRRARQRFGRIYVAQTQAWQSALDDAMARGEIARLDARYTALAIVSLAHGLAIQRLRGWSDVPLADHVAYACTLLWKGLAVR
jgi:hypothetical protein